MGVSPMSLLSRVAGVFFSPRATYTAVAAYPRALGALALAMAIGVAVSGAFASTEVGRDATLDMTVRSVESFGVTISDEMYRAMETRITSNAVRDAVIAQVLFFPCVSAIVAGLLLGVFTAIMGGVATFKHVFALVAHSGLIISLSQLFVTPLYYARGTISAAASLGVFLPFLDEMSFLARLLGSIDLFLVWWLVNLAIGLGVLYKRRTQPVAIGLLALYVGIAVVVAAVLTAISGA